MSSYVNIIASVLDYFFKSVFFNAHGLYFISYQIICTTKIISLKIYEHLRYNILQWVSQKIWTNQPHSYPYRRHVYTFTVKTQIGGLTWNLTFRIQTSVYLCILNHIRHVGSITVLHIFCMLFLLYILYKKPAKFIWR